MLHICTCLHIEIDHSNKKQSSTSPTELPDSVGQLSHLQYLNLFNNRLRTLPQTLSYLSKLRFLSVAYVLFWKRGDQQPKQNGPSLFGVCFDLGVKLNHTVYLSRVAN